MIRADEIQGNDTLCFLRKVLWSGIHDDGNQTNERVAHVSVLLGHQVLNLQAVVT
jgi:hypothetical protein